MQNFTDVADSTTLTASRTQLTNNDKTIMSCSSGTAFPSTNLQVGMLCFRTDQLKLYELQSTGPDTWTLLADYNKDFWTQVATAASGTDTYTATLSPVPGAYVTDQLYVIKFANANTSGTPTLNLNALGNKTIKRIGGGQLAAGDIAAGMYALLHYNGTDFILLNRMNSAEQSQAVATSGTNTYTATLSPVPTAYVTNQVYMVKFVNASTSSAPTINLNSLGAKTIKHIGGLALLAGDLPANFVGMLVYDGTDMILQNPYYDPLERTQTLTDGATINWDVSQGRIAKVTLGGNRTIAAPTNFRDGSYVLHVIQDGSGGRTLTWNAVFKWMGGIAPTLSTAGNSRDIVSFTVENGNFYGSHGPAFS